MADFNPDQKQRRKKTLLNDYRQPHPTSTEPLPGAKYPAQLMWEQAINGKLLLKVNDGVWKEGAKTNHKEVEMDYAHRGILFEALLDATQDANFKMKVIPVQWKQYVFAGGQSKLSDSAVLQANLSIIRDKDGCITLGYSKGDYKAQFKFKGPKETTVMVKNDAGERVEDHGLMSRWAVRAWVNFHRPMLDRMDNDAWEPAKPKGDAAQRQDKPAAKSFASDGFDDDDVDF